MHEAIERHFKLILAHVQPISRDDLLVPVEELSVAVPE
jgi:hypothetical protein